MNKLYVPYHMHSDYSLLDSCTKFSDYVDLCVSNGYKAIASTEHGLPRGWFSKKQYCDKNGIKFIYGVEIYLTEGLLNSDGKKVRDNYHTVLLARNMDGIKEMNLLIKKSTQEDHFYYTNRITFDELIGLSDNVITTSACLASPLNKLSEDHPRYKELLRRYDYLEVQPHNHPDQIMFNRRLYELAKREKKPLIVGTDTHSSSPYKAECRSILLKAKHKSYGDEDSLDLSFKTVDELVDMFNQQGALTPDSFLAAIEATNTMADSIEDFDLDTAIKYPILYGSREEDDKKFTETVERKFREKIDLGIIPQEQKSGFEAAIEEEMRVFRKLDMTGFMLSMSELISWCKEQGFAIGNARGSVGGSRVAYITDIIDLNPEQWKTNFARFANENRVEVGDIDIDCVESDRPAIFNHIIDRFGERKTARVASYGTLKSKGVIDEIGRALAAEWSSKNDEVEKNPYSLKQIDKIKTEFESNESGTKEKYPEIFYYFDGLFDTLVSQSVHPAGMIISPVTLDDNFGVFYKDGEPCLMLDMDESHDAGLVKYDFLILKTVQVIRDTCNYIGIPYPKTHEIDWEDQKVWDSMLDSPISIFQMEKDYAYQCLKKFKPRSIFDMALVTASIRPSGASYRDDLLSRKIHHNPSPMIDELLKDNLGYLCFQEDVSNFLQKICGLSGSYADTIRRAISKKKKEDIDAAMPQILDGYCEKSDKPREVAEIEAKEFLQVIEDASSYGFNYSHAVAYSLLSYLCAYFRLYYPIEFITAFLNNAANDDDIRNGAELAKMHGIKVTTPKFGLSRAHYQYDKESGVIARGMESIKFISKRTANMLYKLAQDNQYNYFVDLLEDVADSPDLDNRQLDILLKLDFFSMFGNQKELSQIIYYFTNLLKSGKAKSIRKEKVIDAGLEDIFARNANGLTKAGAESKSWTNLKIRAIEHELEDFVKAKGIPDYSLAEKARRYADVAGYVGFTTGVQSDRNTLYVKEVLPLKRKSDGKLFGYSVIYQSIGSGIDGRMTVFKGTYDKDPIAENDVIRCLKYTKDGKWFQLRQYVHVN